MPKEPPTYAEQEKIIRRQGNRIQKLKAELYFLKQSIKNPEGFTVILGIPGRGTYSSTSDADIWEDAVVEVARQALADLADAISEGDPIELIEVMAGKNHNTALGVDLNMVVLVDGNVPMLMTETEMYQLQSELDLRRNEGREA